MKISPTQALMLALPLAFAFHAHVRADVRDAVAAASARQLEHVYLRCAEVSSKQVMDGSTASHCSLVADALRDRVFGGDFERMLRWWHATRDAGGSDPEGGAAIAPVRQQP